MKRKLAETFAVLRPDLTTAPVEVTPTVYEDLDRGTETPVRLSEPGSYVIVPKGTWHTARTAVSTTMLFVTPGEGTQNRPVR